jgi:predicted nucleic acid-binding protein
MESCLLDRTLVMAPVVLAELLSDPSLPAHVEAALLALPLLETTDGFWQRAGKTRAQLIRRHFRPKLADTLIAQVCLDHHVPLLTRDRDFVPFAKHARLQVLART